ncbi:hypothetical protein [Acinetobacter baumannii]|uniref:hypothetical protein n=1 Tax=Acinetobacter baumannii TaxID=470 RepID=UPI0022B4BE50|nr:hypothetical protein [Acinetobacter baumannii]
MKKRQQKKLNKKAMDLLISCGLCHPDDFESWANDWFCISIVRHMTKVGMRKLSHLST